jgi:hypothetical protein
VDNIKTSWDPIPLEFIALIPISLRKKRGQQKPPSTVFGPYLGARVALQQSPILRAGRQHNNTDEVMLEELWYFLSPIPNSDKKYLIEGLLLFCCTKVFATLP